VGSEQGAELLADVPHKPAADNERVASAAVHARTASQMGRELDTTGFTVAALRRLGIGSERIYVSAERNMQCAIGHCGHCQLGPSLVCRDGPVFRWTELEPWLTIREL